MRCIEKAAAIRRSPNLALPMFVFAIGENCKVLIWHFSTYVVGYDVGVQNLSVRFLSVVRRIDVHVFKANKSVVPVTNSFLFHNA